MDVFNDRLDGFFTEFGQGKKMVLSSSENDRVTSRTMSVVWIGGRFYFQTDRLLKKYRQLIANPHVALCVDNIQIEGICEDIGHPKTNSEFCEIFRTCYSGSYQAYSSLQNERLFSVTPTRIERWIYRDGTPFIEEYDLIEKHYTLNEYKGE